MLANIKKSHKYLVLLESDEGWQLHSGHEFAYQADDACKDLNTSEHACMQVAVVGVVKLGEIKERTGYELVMEEID